MHDVDRLKLLYEIYQDDKMQTLSYTLSLNIHCELSGKSPYPQGKEFHREMYAN